MITRFAPSPTGPLHLGHAFAAIYAHDLAKAAGGTFLVRIEDIDQSRARAEWEEAIYDDLAWLGLSWQTPVMRQSDRKDAYMQALDRLWEMGLLYACSCNRRDIQSAVEAPQEGGAPLAGPDGLIYPGTCRDKNLPRSSGALRLSFEKALQILPSVMTYFDNGELVEINTSELPKTVGDIIVARRDMGTSYHLSVVVDDAGQAITDVTRGQDLQEATKIHVTLQTLLGLPTPVYHHHKLIRDDAGKRLAKRDDARAISRYRADGLTPTNIREMLRL